MPYKVLQSLGEYVSQNRYVGKDVFTLRTKNEDILEHADSEKKTESQLGTDSNDQCDRHMTQEERVKISVDRNGILRAQRI